MKDQPFLHRVASFLQTRTTLLIVAFCLLLAAVFALLPRVEVAPGLRDSFYDRTSDLQARLDRVSEQFASDNDIFIVYRAKDVFAKSTLEAVRRLCDRLTALTITREDGEEEAFALDDVISITTEKDAVGTVDAFRSMPLVPDPIPDDPGRLAEIAGRSRRNPVIRANLLGNNATVAGIVARLPSGFTEGEEATILERIKGLLADAEGETSDIRLALSGEPAFRAELARYQLLDIVTILPVAMTLLSVLILLFVRRIRGLLFAVVALLTSQAVLLALLTLAGGALNPVVVLLPALILAITLAMVLHYVSEYGKNSATDAEPAHKTMRELLPPVFVAATTTAVAFAAFALSEVPAIRSFGLTAFGTTMVVFLVVVVLVAVVFKTTSAERLISTRGLALSGRFDRTLTRASDFVIRRHRPLTVCFAALFLFLLAGIFRLDFDANWLWYFDEDLPIRRATTMIDDDLGGTMVYAVTIRVDEEDRFTDPAELRKLKAVEGFLRDAIDAERVTSVVDYVEVMHREFYDGTDTYMRIPDTQGQVAQLLLLNSDTSIDEYIDHSHRWVRIVARNRCYSAAGTLENYDRIDTYLARQFPAEQGYQTDAIGTGRVNARMSTTLIRTQAQSLSLTFTIILVLFFVLFGSLRVGLIAMVPNVVPVVSVLGIMGWVGVKLEVVTVLVSGVALGIAVDDTVHVVSYLRARLRAHGDLLRAIPETFQMKGPAVVWTTVVMTVSFASFLAGRLLALRWFGICVGVGMVMALLSDLVLLPALLVWTRASLGIRRTPAER